MRTFYFALVLFVILLFVPENALSEIEKPIPTYMPFKISKTNIIQVSIHADSSIPKENINAVIDGIMSDKSFIQNGKLYFKGWHGTLIDSAKHHGTTVQPLNIKIVNSYNSNSDVIVILTSSQSDQGYSGLTTFTTEHNMIKNAHITIYQANDLTTSQTSAITRHEFGHALGLSHSNIISDLMYPSFTVASAFISQLDEISIGYLYH